MILILCRLLRPRLALVNGVAALAGYFLFPAKPLLAPLALVLAGVSLLAAAGSAYNQIQESGIDRLMLRTRLRPLPSGELTPAAVIVIAVCSTLAGLFLLAAAGGYPAVLLGASALVWYLVVYTPLKRRSSYALAVGAVCGSIPPLIGWSVAGGGLDFRVLLLSGVLYLWQIPHFWLLQRRHAEDYRRAGIPSVAAAMSAGAFRYLFRLWVVALLAAAMLLPAFGLVGHRAAPWYAAFPLLLALMAHLGSEKGLHSCLNLFPLVVTSSLIFERFFLAA